MNELINLEQVNKNTTDLAQQIVDEDNIEEVKKLVNIFNANQQKKNVVRIIKLNQLLDTVADKIQERVEKRGDELTSQELLQCLQVITNTVDKANKDLNGVQEVPVITYSQNNQINVNLTDTLSRESREKITNVVKDIIAKANQMQYPILENIETSEVKDDEL